MRLCSTLKRMERRPWRVKTSMLPHASYFESQTRPLAFDHVEFLEYLQPTSDQRRELTSIWQNTIIPALRGSKLPELREMGNRLKNEWTSMAAGREAFWRKIANQELEKQKQDRMARLKLSGEKRLQAAEDFLVVETQHEFAQETEKLRSISREAREVADNREGEPLENIQAGPSSMASDAPAAAAAAADADLNCFGFSFKAGAGPSSTSLPTVGPSSVASPPSFSSLAPTASLSRSSSPAPTMDTTHLGSMFLPRSLFDIEDEVDPFFFDNPISGWANVRAFCSALLNEKYLTSSKSAYQRYTKSLLAIKRKLAVDDQVRDHAGDILKTRESSFRTDYFYVDNLLQQDSAGARKHSLVEAEEEEPTHLALHFDLESSGSIDGDFQPGERDSETDSIATYDEDLTGEIPEPIEMDRLVGQGDFSSQLSAEGHHVIGDCDISTTVMRHRRNIIRQPTLTEVDDLLLTNFVVSRSLLLNLFPAEKVDAAFPSHDPVALKPAELDLVGRLSACATTYSYDHLQQWFDQQPKLTTSIVHRAISSYFWEAGLWSDCNWYRKGTGDNEDTFTSSLIRPLLTGAFGDFAGCSFRWSRDSLRSGKSEDLDARLQLPDYQVSTGAHSIILGEFKTALAPLKALKDDYVKLVFMGKKAVDGLYKAGFRAPVILIHGRGMSVDVYRLGIRSEAIYHLQLLGTFRLISGPFEFPLLLGIGPLVSARAIAMSTFDMIKLRKTVPTNKKWTRGTFDVKGITISVRTTARCH